MWVESCLHTSGRKGAREGAATILEEGSQRDEASSAIRASSDFSATNQILPSWGSILAAARPENSLKKNPGPQLMTF